MAQGGVPSARGGATPNVIEHYDLVVEGDQAWLTMELVEGPSLEEACRPGGEPDLAVIRRVFSGLASALAAIHQVGVLHRDVCARNVLLDEDARPRLIDLGLAMKLRGLERSPAGTPLAMAPEALMGRVSAKSDYFSLGVLLFQTLQGAPPFDEDFSQGLVEKSMGRLRNVEGLEDSPDDLVAAALGWLQPDSQARPGAEALVDVTPAPSLPPFVGRAEELRVLVGGLLRVGPDFAWGVVRGESGIGKSRLGEELGRRSPTAIHVRCHPRETLRFNAFDSVAEALAQRLVGDPALPQEAVAAASRLFPTLATLLGADPPAAMGDPDAGAVRSAGFAAVIALLARAAREVPLLLWIDDAQWMDRDSVDLLAALVRGRPRSVRVLLTTRPEATPELELLGRSQPPDVAVSLEPLSEEMTLALVRRAVPHLSAERVDALVAAAEGSPFLALDGALSDSARGAGDVLDELGGAAERVFRLVAIAGRPLEAALLHQAVGDEAQPAVTRLRKARLLRSLDRGDERVAPYHSRLAERVLAVLARETRLEVHRQLVDAYDSLGAPDPDHIAPHLLALNDPRAREVAIAAAEGAATRLAFQRAATLFEQAASLQPRLGAQDSHSGPWVAERVATCCARLGDAARSARWYLEATRRLPAGTSSERSRLARLRAEVLLAHGHVDEGLQALRALLGDVGVRIPSPGVGALVALAWERFRLRMTSVEPSRAVPQGDGSKLAALHVAATSLALISPIQATALAGRYLRLARGSADPRSLTVALCIEVALAANLGGPGDRRRALEVLAEVDSVAELHGGEYEKTWVTLTRGTVSLCAGRPAEAADQYQRGLDRMAATEWGDDGMIAKEAVRTYVLLYPALAYSGDLKRLSPMLESRLRDAEARNDYLHREACLHGQVSLVLLARGEAERAWERSIRGRDEWPSDDFGIARYHHMLAASYIGLYQDEPERAWAVIDGLWGAARRAQFLRMEMLKTELWHA